MLSQMLLQREAEGRPIHVGIIGTGKFGAGLVAQISQMKGMVTSAIADTNLDHARHAWASSGIEEDQLRQTHTAAEIDEAIRAGVPAITEDAMTLIRADLIDVIVESTGIPAVGARHAYEAIAAKKHVVMVNVEADVTVGAILRRQADTAGVVYTMVDGDQPGATMNIVDWCRTLGFEIVAAGRGTIMLEDDFEGTPDTVPERFGFSQEVLERRTINLRMYNTFRDGTKAQVEMTALANAAGLTPDVRGMHEPSANLEDIPRLFSLQEEGGLLGRHGVVELANSVELDGSTPLGNPLNMGVFVVARTEHPFTQEDLATYYVHPSNNGKNFLFYRPYHLVAVTAPISIAKAALYGQPTGSALPTPTADVITVAKRDLKTGEVLDGGGGYTVNGICERADTAHVEGLLPLGLSYGAKLTADVRKGTAISYDMVEDVQDTFVTRLRKLQDAIVWNERA